MLAWLFITAAGYAEKRYVIKKIHDEGSNYFDLNNLGEVAFVGLDSQERQFIYFYSGGVIHQITEVLPYRYWYSDLDLNDKGQIAWAMESYEDPGRTKGVLMIYDGAVRKAVDSLYKANLLPRINNSGTVVFHLQPYYGAYGQVYKYDGVLTSLTSQKNPNGWPQINNNGLIAWHGDSRDVNIWANRIRYILPGETEVRTIVPGVNEGFSGVLIDDLNNIVFNRLRYNSPAYSICLFDGTQVKTIADTVYQYSYWVNNGNVAYLKNIAGKNVLYLFDGSGHSQISLPETDNYDPMVNSSGMVVWRDSKNQVYVKREDGTKLVGTDCQKPPRINNDGLIAFAGYDWDYYGSAIYIGEYKDVFDVTGKVVKDGYTGPGIAGVSVLMDNKVVATTDASGEFICPNLEPGSIALTFSLAGYSFDPPVINISLNAHTRITPDIIGRTSSGIRWTETDSNIQVYPVPANNELIINIGNSDFSNGQVTIFDLTGADVGTFPITGKNLRIDISTLKPGTYFCRFKIRNGIQVKEFIKLD